MFQVLVQPSTIHKFILESDFTLTEKGVGDWWASWLRQISHYLQWEVQMILPQQKTAFQFKKVGFSLSIVHEKATTYSFLETHTRSCSFTTSAGMHIKYSDHRSVKIFITSKNNLITIKSKHKLRFIPGFFRLCGLRSRRLFLGRPRFLLRLIKYSCTKFRMRVFFSK